MPTPNSPDAAGARRACCAPVTPDMAGGIREGVAGHDTCFIHRKGNDAFPIGGEGVLIELVQAPRRWWRRWGEVAAVGRGCIVRAGRLLSTLSRHLRP